MAPAFDDSATPHANADELHDLQESIAQGLSTISDLGDVPVGCDVSADPFTPDDVTFSGPSGFLVAL
jgi:hypothetical protein